MTNRTSFRDISLDLNGHEFETLAAIDDPIKFQRVSILEYDFSRDGALYLHDKAIKGGEVTVLMHATSNSAIRCLRWFAERQNDVHLEFEGTYQDSELGFALRLLGGAMIECDPIIVPKKNFEVMFVFEEFLPNVDGANFTPPPRIQNR